MKIASALLAATLALGAVSAVQAETAMTDDAGMTLYVFDKDADGVSSCYDDCAVNWPPYLGAAGEEKGEGWTLAARTDGAMQWVYDGKPLYFYYEDKAAGDMKGDGKGGVWHVVTK